MVSGDGIKVDPKKIKTVQSWPRPSTAIEIRSFLSLAGYYHHFVERILSIAAPLAKQQRSLGLLKDYDITNLYHSGKANVVADARSRKAKSMGSLAFIPVIKRPLAVDYDDPHFVVLKDSVFQGYAKNMAIGDDGVLRLQGQICVPNVDGLMELILEEVKYEHQRPSGLVQRLTKSANFIPVMTSYTSDKLAKIYIIEIVLLYGMPVSIISDRDTQFKSHFWRAISERFSTAKSRKKSYADRKVCDVAFMELIVVDENLAYE
ncbi:uncharacterized protein [Nicotiana tomentosiformis]|uniref:uncharacterized protein n=1 Tax=Nicotiana tomentosiformis TaxID=4098 RepID=UPI00388CC585